jgi:hypothetical protein
MMKRHRGREDSEEAKSQLFLRASLREEERVGRWGWHSTAQHSTARRTLQNWHGRVAVACPIAEATERAPTGGPSPLLPYPTRTHSKTGASQPNLLPPQAVKITTALTHTRLFPFPCSLSLSLHPVASLPTTTTFLHLHSSLPPPPPLPLDISSSPPLPSISHISSKGTQPTA